MSLTARRWLYSIFILAFFAITTVVFSYANGYFINWANGQLIKTGTFVFKTSPANARIYLNGQLQTEFLRLGKKQDILTPTKLKNLLPGEYDVKFELSGFHPWEKKLTIKPGESTYAETVELFPASEPLAISDEDAFDLSLSAGNGVIGWRTSNNVRLFDLKSNAQKLEVVGRPSAYSLQEDVSHVLVDDSVYGSSLAIPLFSIRKLVGSEVKNIQFVDGQDKVAYSLKNKIESIDLTNQKITTLLNSSSSDIINFYALDNMLQVMSASSSRYFWEFYRDGELMRSLELPVGDYAFSRLDDNWLALLDSEREMAYLVQPSLDKAPIKTIKHCKGISFIDDDGFLCNNEYEIFIYHAESQSSTLLDRLSEPVLFAYWHKSDNYVVYLTNSAVYTLELDQRDYRNKTKIIEVIVSDSVYDRDSSILYIGGQRDGQKGVFVLKL